MNQDDIFFKIQEKHFLEYDGELRRNRVFKKMTSKYNMPVNNQVDKRMKRPHLVLTKIDLLALVKNIVTDQERIIIVADSM
jgi:hypothetical protein